MDHPFLDGSSNRMTCFGINSYGLAVVGSEHRLCIDGRYDRIHVRVGFMGVTIYDLDDIA